MLLQTTPQGFSQLAHDGSSNLSVRTFSVGRRGGVTLSARSTTVVWHANGEWRSEHLFEDGTVVATCAKDLAFLQLYDGTRRISIAEADAATAQ
jgi:hypothetical protein